MYFLRLPSGNLINLALARFIEIERIPSKIAIVHWTNNHRSVFTDSDVDAISVHLSNTPFDFFDKEERNAYYRK